MPARFRNDPVALMLAAFDALYPDVDVVLKYKPARQISPSVSNAEAASPSIVGLVRFPTDGGGPPEIWLNMELPVSSLPAVLTEELARVVAGPYVPHGPEFQVIVNALQTEFARRAALPFEAPAAATGV